MIGQTIASRYRVLDHLGSGGMATVYRVYDERLEREVALKLLTPKASGNSPIKRFCREFQTVNRLRHPNVIELYDIEELAGGGYFFTMQLLESQTLDDELRREGSISPQRAREITRQIALALTQLHETNIIHRDLKPSNIIFAADGRAVLTDFGLALNLDLTGITETGAIVGTPVYMSPEQLFTGAFDGRSDIYQLGVIFYQMVCGELPFSVASLPVLITNIKYDEAEPLHKRQPLIKKEWSLFAAKAMDKDPDKRFRTANEMIEALDQLPDMEPLPLESAEPTAVMQKSTLLKTYTLLKRKLSGPVRLGALLVFMLLFIGLILVFKPQTTYTVQVFKARPGPESVTLSWRSNKPYPSVVEIKDKEGKVRSTNPSAPQTTIHQVTVTDLKPEKPYTAVVILPNGRSLAKAVKAHALRVKLLKLQRRSSELHILLYLPQCKKITANAGNDAVTAIAESSFSWRLQIGNKDIRRVQIEAQLQNGLKRSFTLAYLLKERIKELSTSFSKFQARRFFSDVANDMGRDFVSKMEQRDSKWSNKPILAIDAISSDRRQRQLRAVHHHLKPLQLQKQLRDIRQVSPLIFTADAVPFAQRYLLYKRLQEMTRLLVYLRRWDLDELFSPTLLPQQGIFSLAMTPLTGRVERIFIKNTPHSPLLFGMCIPAISPPRQIDKWNTKLHFKKSNDIKHTALELYCQSFTSLALRITLNRKYEFYLCDRPLFNHPSDTLVLLRQNIPVECWQDGENTLEFLVEWIFDDITSSSIAVERIILAKKFQS